MLERHDYPVSLRWTGEARGLATSDDGLPDLWITAPPEFGGHANEWSPEHLLVASVASCFMTTFLAIAGNSKLPIQSLEVAASGHLERGEDRRYSITRVELTPRIVIADEALRPKAERLAVKADEICLISRSLKSEIVVEPTIEVEAREPALVG